MLKKEANSDHINAKKASIAETPAVKEQGQCCLENEAKQLAEMTKFEMKLQESLLSWQNGEIWKWTQKTVSVHSLWKNKHKQ